MSSSQSDAETASGPSQGPAAAISFHVPDMSCGHCVKTITGAIESAVPGAKVKTDLASHVVTVEGSDSATLSGIIKQAGYSPSPVQG